MKKIFIGIAALALLISCNQMEGVSGSNNDSTNAIKTENTYKAKIVRDESITKENSYSDFFLDSSTLENYIKQENIEPGNAEKMRGFYLIRNNQFAWFSSDGITEQARALWSMHASGEQKTQRKPPVRIEEKMDSLLVNDSVSFSSTDTSLLQTELALTAQFVQLASANKGAVTEENFYWLVPRKKMDALQLADSMLNKQADSSLGENILEDAALKNALQFYYTAVKNGGWDSLFSLKRLSKGNRSPQVTLLKKRLAATGDYPADDTSALFSDSLVIAIKNVQEQYGLVPTGKINDSLTAELNVPAQQRLQQILVNMNRALWLPAKDDSSRIMINIPSQQLFVYDGGAKVMDMPVIIGKEGTGTMAFNDEITQVIFNPYWNIPPSIVKNEIKPAMEKDKNYQKKNNMEIVKQDDSVPQIRQMPGKDNALGRVKFLFPNSFDIYLHDTPHKNLFEQKNRALSHGCIRVAKPDSLAHYILRGQEEWTFNKISAAMNSNKEQTVQVKKPVPVSITYSTAWIDQKGKMNFRHDIYGYDKKTAVRMFTNPSSI